MRIRGTLKKTRIVVLADTGSTHNFLSLELAARLGLEPDRHTEFEVLVANGERLSSKGKCSEVQVWSLESRGMSCNRKRVNQSDEI
jgi:predicted aspartyl protease